MPVCPKCRGAWLCQTDDPETFICISCKAKFKLTEIKKD